MNYQKITLIGGAEVQVDFDSNYARCNRCHAPIRFGITVKNGKTIPLSEKAGKWQAHFADCEHNVEARRPSLESRIEDEEKNREALNNLEL